MEYKNVMLVDEEDNFLGEMEKIEAHEKGLLHRAFSIMLFQQTASGIEILLQKRADDKYHCSGQWTNTCCSHPQENMPMQMCLEKRLDFEMGIKHQKLALAGTFTYKEICKGGLTEHEFDHVYIGDFVPTNISPNPHEVSEYAWVSLETIESDIANQPDQYTPWLFHVIKITKDYIQKQQAA